MSVLQVSDIFGQPLGNLVYHLVLLLAVEAALAMAWGEWRRAQSEQAKHLLLAMVGLTLVRVCYIVAGLLAWAGLATPEVLLPPLERFADTASIAILGWAFIPPAKRRERAWDVVFGANLVLAVGVWVVFTVLWNQDLATSGTLGYNDYWQSIVWSAWQMGLILLVAVAVTRSKGEGWGTVLLAMIVMFLGHLLQLVYPQGPADAHLSIWERLANLVAYPLIAIAVYQRIFAGLRVQSRQLQDISQASLDQIKSLLYLFEASQRMSSSLDLSTVLDNAVEGVARALDADQCAIAFPSEHDPTQMRLVAIYNPARQGRGEVVTFPLEYQLAVQQAMRRKSYVIVEGQDNVQLRALFALLGSSQTGPLLVQPLMADGATLGAIIVGNARSRRPFTPNEAKLCQAMAEQMVSAIRNTRRYRIAQSKIAELTAAQTEAGHTSQQADAQAQRLTDRLASSESEIEALRQARNALEIKLVSSRAETDTLARRLAALENDLARQQSEWPAVPGAALPGMAAGILVTDTTGLIQVANTAAEALLGRERAELQNLQLEDISDDAQWRQAVTTATGGGVARSTLQAGTNLLMCDMAPLLDPNSDQNQMQGLVVVLQDLSPVAEAQHTQMEAVTAMADELRTPMTTIIGYADLLLSEAMGGVEDVQRKFLLRIKAGAERAIQMVNDLARETGEEERQSHPQRQTVHVNELVEGAVAASRVQIEDKILTLDLELDDDLPAVKADPDYLQRVLSCLLSNACLASPVGGRIEVQAVPSKGTALDQERLVQGNNGYVAVSVRDSGGGLSDEALSQVFERTRPSQTPPGLGESGAGLASVKSLVEAHGGSLWVESEDGVGTTFRFVLPVNPQEETMPVDHLASERDVAVAG